MYEWNTEDLPQVVVQQYNAVYFVYTRYAVPQVCTRYPYVVTTYLLLLLRCCDSCCCCCCCTLLLMLYIGAALYDCCCRRCCCTCCSVLLLYYKKNAEVLLLRTAAHTLDMSCVAPSWTARFLCTYTHHGWLYCTGRIFDCIKFTSEGKSCIMIMIMIILLLFCPQTMYRTVRHESNILYHNTGWFRLNAQNCVPD